MEQKFHVGEHVSCGAIVAVHHPAFFSHQQQFTLNLCIQDVIKKYDEVWGGPWKDNPVYIINLNEPTRQISYEDFLFKAPKDAHLEWIRPECYREYYEKSVPLRKEMFIPEHLIDAQIVGDGGFDLEKVQE